jgi:site-specific recombinase XerD
MNSLAHVANEFLDAKAAERYSPSTLKSYFSILNAFCVWVRGHDIDIADIQPADIRAYLGSLVGVADKTVYNHHICLSSLWTFALEAGYVDHHVVRSVRAPKIPERRVVPFTEEEARRLLVAAKRSRDRAIIMVLLDTGIRRSEICALSVNDWSPGFLKIFGKGKKERLVPLSPPTEASIQAQLLDRKVRGRGVDGGSALFACVISGHPMTGTTISSVMRRLEKYSGVKGVHCHRFRHAFAITYLRNGGDIYTLQKILGHSSLETVKIYLDIVRTDIEAAHRTASPILNWKLG